jgi:hypothetical protein
MTMGNGARSIPTRRRFHAKACMCVTAASGPGLFDDAGDLFLAAAPGVSERRDAVPVRKVRVGAGGEDKAGDLLVARSPVAEDHNLQQAGPAEIVDVVHVDTGREQQRHRLRMGAFAGRDERVAAEPIADRQIRLLRQHHRDDLGAPARASEEPRGVEIGSLRVHARARLEERPRDLDVVRIDSEEKRRASVSIARLGRRAGSDQTPDLRKIARRSRPQQPGTGAPSAASAIDAKAPARARAMTRIRTYAIRAAAHRRRSHPARKPCA